MARKLLDKRGHIAKFHTDENGAATVQALFFAIMFMLIGGLAVDGGHLWRHHQLLKQTSDIAAHAAMVELAKGNTVDDAEVALRNMVETNMPLSRYGRLLTDGSSDISFLSYNPDTNTIDQNGPTNAVSVTLHRDESTSNPLDTFVLRIADILDVGAGPSDLSQWNVAANSIATFSKTKKCKSSDGIYAQEPVSLSGDNTIGGGYCVHSQDTVWMPQSNTFMPGSALSMPDLANCNDKCQDAANPGTTAASFQTNLILPDYRTQIIAAKDSFLGTGDPTMKNEFFSNKSLEVSALAPLEAAPFRINTSVLSKGSVVEIDQRDFNDLTDLPEGLVYHVRCRANGGPDLDFDENNAGNDLRNLALITNCNINFSGSAKANAVAIITYKDRANGNAAVSASSGASIGGDVSTCSKNNHSFLFALGDMHVASKFVGSNLTVIADGDIHFSASSSSTSYSHSGLSMHSTGEISITTGHEFKGCADPPAGITLELRVIRHIVPETLVNVAG